MGRGGPRGGPGVPSWPRCRSGPFIPHPAPWLTAKEILDQTVGLVLERSLIGCVMSARTLPGTCVALTVAL